MSELTRLRCLMGPAAVFSVREAAALLPMGDRRARAWLRERGIVRVLDGKEVVRWGDVLAALEVDERPQVRRPVRLRRAVL